MRFFLALCCLSVTAVCSGQVKDVTLEKYKEKLVQIYSPGIINPKEGTIELTVKPTKPGTEFENDWAFAVCMVPGQQMGASTARTLLGICATSGENNIRQLMSIVRNGDEKAFSSGTESKFLTKGKNTNLAFSWGKNGTHFYVNGKECGSNGFSGEMTPMSAIFSVCQGAPFGAHAFRVSNRQLAANEIAANPEAEFTTGPDTTCIANGTLDRAQYRAVAGLGDFSALMPVWNMAEAINPAGTPAQLKFISSNYAAKPVNYHVELKIYDVEQKEIGVKTYDFELAPKTIMVEKTLLLPLDKAGFYNLEMKVKTNGKTPQKWSFTHAVIPAEDRSLKDGKFAEYLGHHLFNLSDVLAKLNIRWSRSDAFPWYVVEPEKGKFDWAWSDKIVNSAVKNNVKTLGILGVPPVWAADAKVIPTHPNAYMSGRRKPAKIKEWENYIYQVVSRYKDRVKYWEIWNEVDWHPPVPAASFSGTTQEYFELLKVAYQAAKKADPECQILVSGFGYGSVNDLKMPFELLKMGAGNYCDIYNVHSYRALCDIDELVTAVNQAKPGMPLWQSEQMWHTVADVRKQSALTAAIFFWFVDKKFDKYFSFGEDFFFSLYTLCPNPVVSTLATAQNQLRKCDKFDGLLTEPKLKYYDLKHQFRRTDGSYFTVLGKLGTLMEIQLSGDVTRLEDVYGREIEFTRQDGICTPALPFEIIFVVSKKPLGVITEKTVSSNLCTNGGFEMVSGDVAMVGIKNLVLSQWRFREKTYDPEGDIRLTHEAHSGSYALAITSSGKGRVYAFFEQKVSEPGVYELSFQAKAAGEKPCSAYFDVYDLSTKEYKRYQLGEIKPAEFRNYKLTVNFAKPSLANVAFSLGVEKAGTVLFDDVTLELMKETAIEGAKCLEIKNLSPKLSFNKQKNVVDVAELAKQAAAKPVINRIPFQYSDYPVMLSAAPWSNITGKTVAVTVDGKSAEVALLITAMYVPANTKELGTVKLTYQDGSSSVIALENKKQVRDWFLTMGSGPVPVIKYAVAPSFNEYGAFLVRVPNPKPQSPLASIEVSSSNDGLLCLLAATLIPAK